MSLACCLPIVECVYCLACARWAWKRLLHSAGHDSETWGLASAVEFEPVPRLCRYILAVYEDDLDHPQWAPPGGYGIDTRSVVFRKTYEDTHGRAPPYLIYVDHKNSDIVLAIRGFNFAQEGDYALLLDNGLGKRKFSGGYVHNGLLTAAVWVFDAECKILRELLEKYPEGIKHACCCACRLSLFWHHKLMLEKERLMVIPPKPRMERQKTIDREHSEEHEAALRRAVIMAVPDAYLPSTYGTFNDQSTEGARELQSAPSSSETRNLKLAEWIKQVFEKDDSGEMVLRK
ncbi:hypothetical protein BHE74_00011660 [Ensete ventricosum]|nr:hypothetical protein GW17_00024872 [Ensete ventricosum]RWW80023.1 hypothetical protein BHE74_00011660 [Ensete ventricosum]RZR85150.1 hypothetical protein BHM03_00012100 [Ensete ventricosum]